MEKAGARERRKARGGGREGERGRRDEGGQFRFAQFGELELCELRDEIRLQEGVEL